MKLSMSNGIFRRFPLEKNLTQIKQLGFENIEFNMKTVKREHEEMVYDAMKLLSEIGLNCLTLHSQHIMLATKLKYPGCLLSEGIC